MTANNGGSRLYQLEKQLELAEIVVKLTNGHMWSMFADRAAHAAVEMKVHIEKEIKKEKGQG